MLYDLIQKKKDKEEIVMTDSLPKVLSRMKELRSSYRGKPIVFSYKESNGENKKFQKKPCTIWKNYS